MSGWNPPRTLPFTQDWATRFAVKATASSYNPISTGSLAFWLTAQDPATVQTSGGQVFSWLDKTANGNNAIQARQQNQPLYVVSGINGRPSLQFTVLTTANNLTIADSASLNYSEFTLMIVAQRRADLGANERLVGKWNIGANQREFSALIQADDSMHSLISSTGGAATSNVDVTACAIALFQNYILETGYDGVRNRVAVNGMNYVAVTASAPFQGISGVFIGSNEEVSATFGEIFQGYIGEIRFFVSALTTQQRTDNLNDLRARWGL